FMQHRVFNCHHQLCIWMVGAVLVEGGFPTFCICFFGSGLFVACPKMLSTIPTPFIITLFGGLLEVPTGMIDFYIFSMN
ncbi:hypothetical protein, partial [Staphylococcus haemolyticus]|uniref:hypothetical protein n=1 Tax=Staphylococcus haemolyticus TaxID=1283 RepID=UPI003B7FD052